MENPTNMKPITDLSQLDMNGTYSYADDIAHPAIFPDLEVPLEGVFLED